MEALRTDYCVVGAGFAGLAAALRLRDCGKSVALVEASDRVGGRVWNRTAADGSVVSVGGTWLGKRQDRVFELCREFGMEVYPQYDQGDTMRIKQSNTGVKVFSDRLTVDARRVIVATPPLLASRIAYDPLLPAPQTQLLRRMLSGSALRGITIYDEPFWRKDGLSGMSVAPDLPVPVALDQSPRSNRPGILSSYMFGPQAVRAAALDPAERRNIWLQALSARYGSKALSPRAHLETDWAAQEWTLGGMIAHFAPGVLTNYGHALREPAGRIHWAGSERATEMHGLIEGAVRSGEIAADQVVNSAT